MTESGKKLNPGPLYLTISAICWSTAGVLTKLIPFGAMTVACIRGIIAALIQVIYLFFTRKEERAQLFSLKGWLKRPIVLTAICYLGESSLFMFANKMTSAGSAIVLQNTSPVYLMLMGLIFLRKKPSGMDCCVGAVIFSGILLSMMDTLRGGALPGSNPMLGNLLALLSGVFYAGVFFTSQLPGADALRSTILGNAMYFLFLPFVFSDPAVMHPQSTGVALPMAWGAMLFMGVIQMAIPWITFSLGISRTPALQASFITMIEPVLNPILAFFFLQEAMGGLSVAGSVLVVVTILIYNILSARREEKQRLEQKSEA